MARSKAKHGCPKREAVNEVWQPTEIKAPNELGYQIHGILQPDPETQLMSLSRQKLQISDHLSFRNRKSRVLNMDVDVIGVDCVAAFCLCESDPAGEQDEDGLRSR
jgi:hypothetical protein